jgi:succinate dehydrogenase / fumarate reductase flavoprotein subunit
MARDAPTAMELAPCDLVCRAIAQEIREGRGAGPDRDHVLLDLTHLEPEHLDARLPEVVEFARTYLGIEPHTELVPVAPTAHYALGGVPTTIDAAVRADNDTIVPGLYAAGEVACVSAHGAHGLGGNALLDVIVFGRRAGVAAAAYAQAVEPAEVPPDVEASVARLIDGLRSSAGAERAAAVRAELQQTMDRHAQVHRSERTLRKAQAEVAALTERYRHVAIMDQGQRFNTDLVEAIELGFLLELAAVFLAGALARTESRGSHAREDHPDRDDLDFLRHTMAYREPDGTIRLDNKPVVITGYEPTERTY